VLPTLEPTDDRFDVTAGSDQEAIRRGRSHRRPLAHPVSVRMFGSTLTAHPTCVGVGLTDRPYEG